LVGDLFLERLLEWRDRLHGVNIEGWRRLAWELNEVLPEAVEAEKKFDFHTADDFTDGFHGTLATGALEGIAASYS
jgi:hypothetical protein